METLDSADYYSLVIEEKNILEGNDLLNKVKNEIIEAANVDPDGKFVPEWLDSYSQDIEVLGLIGFCIRQKTFDLMKFAPDAASIFARHQMGNRMNELYRSVEFIKAGEVREQLCATLERISHLISI